MKILSNSELETLVSDLSPKLKAIVSVRAKQDPNGSVSDKDLDAYIHACRCLADKKAVMCLKNLKALAKSGKLQEILSGKDKYTAHLMKWAKLIKCGEAKFMLNDRVCVKETGKFGQVVDYIPDQKVYIVVLDPFQVKEFKSNELKSAHAISA